MTVKAGWNVNTTLHSIKALPSILHYREADVIDTIVNKKQGIVIMVMVKWNIGQA